MSSARRRPETKPGVLFPEGPGEAARWASALPPGAAGRAWLGYFPETGSTQDEAFHAAARGAVHGSAFLAEHQTDGRGRRSSSWTAPAATSLLLSVLVRPAPPIGRTGRLALAGAVASARAVATVAPSAAVEIKWPNDLLLDGLKLGGILVEVRRGVAVLGLGLNVAQDRNDFPPELRASATSLAAAGLAVDRRALLAAVLIELGALLGHGRDCPSDWDLLRAEADRRLAWRDRTVRVSGCPGGPLSGSLVGLGETGGLILACASGRRVVAASGSLDLEPG